MFTNHSALKYLVNNPMLGDKTCQWFPMFQKFDFEIIVKSGRLNVWPGHLSRLEPGEELTNLDENLLDAQLFASNMVVEYYEDIIHFMTTRKE